MANKYIRWFEDVGLDDVAQVGGKNASLGEMYQQLTAQGVSPMVFLPRLIAKC
ncbi:MAG: pyruvate,water dikinase [Paraglaciecola sp.]|jgi:pyruvate,water dikinase